LLWGLDGELSKINHLRPQVQITRNQLRRGDQEHAWVPTWIDIGWSGEDRNDCDGSPETARTPAVAASSLPGNPHCAGENG